MCSQNSPQIQNTNAPLVEIELLSKKQILKPLLRKKKYSTCLKKKQKKKEFKKIRIFTKTYSKIIMVSKNNDKRNDNTSRKRNKSCEPRQRETICKKKPKIQTKGGIIISKSRKVKEKLTVEEIKKRKKERNRTNAKRFREKRKNFLQQLEHETNQLKSENQNLNHQLNQISQQNLLLRQQVEQLKKIQPTTEITKKPACNNDHNKQTQTRDKIEELNEIEKIDVIDKIDETHIKEKQDEKEKQAETEQNDEIEETEQFEKKENKEKTENKEQNEKKQEHEYFDHRKQIEFLNLEFEKNFKNKYSGMNGCKLFEKDLNWNLSKNNSLLELQQEAILETSGVFYDCGFEIIGKEMNPSNNMDSFENDNNCPLFNPSVWGENFN